MEEPPRMHACWACASQESFVQEPGVARKAKTLLEDANVVENLSRTLNLLQQVAHASFVLLGLALFGLAEASTVGSQPADWFSSLSVLAALSAVATVMVGKTMLLTTSVPSRNPIDGEPEVPYSAERMNELAELMSASLRIETVSHDPTEAEKATAYEEFDKLHDLIEKRFPNVHSSPHVVKRVVNKHSLLFEWKGSDESLDPVMLCAHLDVVPAPNAPKWKQQPFSGAIDQDGFVWGRGAIDNKHNVLMQLQAIEDLLAQGVEQPGRTFFFAYGHDEEIGGTEGAAKIAEVMKGILGDRKLAFVLDEGTFLIKNLLPGVTKPVGVIGNVEKGSIALKLTVDCVPPGHSSIPPHETNVGILARAVDRLESRPLPSHIDMFLHSLTYLGHELPFYLRFVIANKWLFRPLLNMILLQKPAFAASVRTTTAITMMKAGEKVNVVPGEAYAWVNHRIHPFDKDGDTVIAMDRRIIADSRVVVSDASASFPYVPPSPTSPPDAPAFAFLQSLLLKCFHAPSIPSIMVGNTDTRWYWDLSDNIYRHSPIVFEKLEDTKMFHGIDERVSKKQLALLLHFYTTLLRDAASQVP